MAPARYEALAVQPHYDISFTCFTCSFGAFALFSTYRCVLIPRTCIGIAISFAFATIGSLRHFPTHRRPFASLGCGGMTVTPQLARLVRDAPDSVCIFIFPG